MKANIAIEYHKNTNSSTAATEETKWEEIKETVINVTSKVLSHHVRSARNHWYDKECRQAHKRRKEAMEKMIQTKAKTRTRVSE